MRRVHNGPWRAWDTPSHLAPRLPSACSKRRRPCLPSLEGPTRLRLASQTGVVSASCIWAKKGAKARVFTWSVGKEKSTEALSRPTFAWILSGGDDARRQGRYYYYYCSFRKLLWPPPLLLVRYALLSVVSLPGWLARVDQIV